MMIELKSLTPLQKQFYLDWRHRFFVVPAGRRSRKTLIGMRKVLLHALRNPGFRYTLSAPTRQQAKDIFWERLKAETQGLRAGTPSESDLYVEILNGSRIYVMGLDRPERVEGRPWNGHLLTEMGNMRPGTWAHHIRPTLSDTKGFAIFEGAPEGVGNDYYDLAEYAAGGVIPEGKPGGVYAENPQDPDWCFYGWWSSDVLDSEEIESAKRDLDERTFRQEYQASFESAEGRAYYNFGTENLDSSLKYDPELPVHIGMDFNVNPMTATLGHVLGGNKYHQFGEIWLRDSNTYEMAEQIQELFRDKVKNGRAQQIIVYPDSTGKARQTNATESDLAILRKAGFKIRAREANPRVKDRVNAMNSLIKTMSGERRYLVNPTTCEHTLTDLNKVERLPDGRLKDQEDLQLGHVSAALGYLVAYLWPVRKRGEFKLR